METALGQELSGILMDFMYNVWNSPPNSPQLYLQVDEDFRGAILQDADIAQTVIMRMIDEAANPFALNILATVLERSQWFLDQQLTLQGVEPEEEQGSYIAFHEMFKKRNGIKNKLAKV